MMEGSTVERVPFSADFQAAVRTELGRMLHAPIFAQSNRCKRFLSHVVHQTLAGHAGELKERTIGINVFERKNDYDTGGDSIVRVTANEVRKRLGQYYAESAGIHMVQIELPRGSYVPEFRIHPLWNPERSMPATTFEQAHVEHTSSTGLRPSQPQSTSESIVETAVPRDQTPAVSSSAQSRPMRPLVYALFFLVLSAAVGVGVWKVRDGRKGPDLWSPFLHANVPILVCIDTHNLQPLLNQQNPAEGKMFVDLVLRRQSISLDDAAILSSMASELGRKGIRFRVVGAAQTSLADLRRQPFILIGAIDNQWTTLLTQNLPYRIEVANPPGSGSAKEPVASIVDSNHPGNAKWVTDLAVPFAQWKSDYAIVARIDDSTTGVPVLIEAGLGNDGTLAASELITTGALEDTLRNDRSCHEKRNFEAVIETQIIDTKSGPPHMLHLACW